MEKPHIPKNEARLALGVSMEMTCAKQCETLTSEMHSILVTRLLGPMGLELPRDLQRSLVFHPVEHLGIHGVPTEEYDVCRFIRELCSAFDESPA